MNLEQVVSAAAAIVMQTGLRILGAVALWLAGRWLIRFALDASQRAQPFLTSRL